MSDEVWCQNEQLRAALHDADARIAELEAERDRLREALEKIARCAGSGTLADMARAALAKEVGK